MCPPPIDKETDPLLSLPAKTANIVRKNKRKKQKRNRCLLLISLVGLGIVFGSMVVIKHGTQIGPFSGETPSSVLGRAKAAKALVSYDYSKEEYKVAWENGSITPSTTFAELANTMLLPWYEASMMALLEDDVWSSDDGVLPGNVRPIRKTLLITRSMLDVFSPVFPDTPDPTRKTKKKKKKQKQKDESHKDLSLWKELRTMYRHGYQIAGELHDLKGLTYSSDLLEERLKAFTDWREKFLNFCKLHEIRRYLYQDYKTVDIGNGETASVGGIDPNGCYYHDASHLFWSDYARENLPCGNALGPKSLRELVSVQLQHSLDYLDIIEGYTTVMPREHEINFHNLRKELRIFVDEYHLFGRILLPGEKFEDKHPDQDDDAKSYDADGANVHDNDNLALPRTMKGIVHFLDKTQGKLGDINDHWTAHDVYIEEDSHHERQKKLAIETDRLWIDWLDWEAKHNLRGVMNEVLDRLNNA